MEPATPLKKPAATYLPVYLVFLLSALYLAWLVSSSHPGVFFSGDGGVKHIIIKQFSEGHGFKYLYLSQPQWVQEVWGHGFFPLKPPFVYPSPQGYIFVYPPAFQVLSSFFYTRFGDPGLYIIPVASTLLLWSFFVGLLRRCKIPPAYIAFALFILAFCSPLTLYGAIYWEHMTAVLLLFSGVSFILLPATRTWTAIGMGLLSGLACWFRPESMAMNGLYGLAVLILYWKERRPVYIAFLVGMALSGGGFLLFNKLELGAFLGIHSYQILQDEDSTGFVGNGIKNLVSNNKISLKHFAYIVFLLPIVYALLKYKRTLDLRVSILIMIVIAFCLGTPFMVPNEGGRQWGARYFLPIIPIITVVLILVATQWQLREKRKLYTGLLAAVILCTGFSFYLNTYKGGIKTLRLQNAERVKPDLDFIGPQNGKVVIVSQPFIAMDLGYLFDKDYFFLAPGNDSLRRLLPLLKAQGIREYTYISYAPIPDQPSMLKNNNIPPRPEPGDFRYENYTIE
ncbi:MAG TPA: hypothetical protein VGM30_07170 [Puia sp.]|jgi:hypothetical protein